MLNVLAQRLWGKTQSWNWSPYDKLSWNNSQEDNNKRASKTARDLFARQTSCEFRSFCRTLITRLIWTVSFSKGLQALSSPQLTKNESRVEGDKDETNMLSCWHCGSHSIIIISLSHRVLICYFDELGGRGAPPQRPQTHTHLHSSLL